MCGRAYSTYTDEELSIRYLNRKTRVPALKPNYNIAPTQSVPIVFVEEGERRIEPMRWGLIPHWAKDLKIGYSTINAKSETVSEKPAFRAAFKKRRCVVPLSGFFEWRRDGELKRPFAIRLKDHAIMSVAGIWESWGPEELHSFSILTTEANSAMRPIHDRMPVILEERYLDEWLDPANDDTARLKALLRPCPSEWLEPYEISKLVNSPRNNVPEVLEPVGGTGI
jgi:putative SOS response-associated peptidase YedK